MFTDACLPVNELGANSSLDVERPYIDPVPHVLPIPGEDGNQQSISNEVFNRCFALVVLALLIVLLPILQAVRL